MSLIFGFLAAVVIGLIFWFWTTNVIGTDTVTPVSQAPTPAMIQATPPAPLPPIFVTPTP